jgi:hypothetical protein
MRRLLFIGVLALLVFATRPQHSRGSGRAPAPRRGRKPVPDFAP